MSTGMILLSIQKYFPQRKKLPPMTLKSYSAMVMGLNYMDIKDPCRKIDYVTARKLIVFEAKSMGYRWYQIADMINRSKSDTQHLFYQARNHIKCNDREFKDRYGLFKQMIGN